MSEKISNFWSFIVTRHHFLKRKDVVGCVPTGAGKMSPIVIPSWSNTFRMIDIGFEAEG
jgi:hypothetical protein